MPAHVPSQYQRMIPPWKCQRIVVAIEPESEHHKHVHLAGAIARQSGGKLLFVQSVQTPPTLPLLSNIPFGPDSKSLKEAKEVIASEVQRRFSDIPCEIFVGFEEPSKFIPEVARTQNAELIVVGSHGRHGLMELIVGSIPEAVLNDAQCPVMIVGPNVARTEILPLTVLLPLALDASEHLAVGYAVQLQRRLLALHVSSDGTSSQSAPTWHEEEGYRARMRAILEDAGYLPAEADLLVRRGEPAEQVLAQAEKVQAGLIVVSAMRGGFLPDHSPWRILTELVRRAKCPLLAVGPHSGESASERHALIPDRA